MADNVTANAGSGGATFATDDDGTAHHPYVKVEFGADNTQTPVSSANPLPVVQTGTHTVQLGATDNAVLDAIAAAAQATQAAVEGTLTVGSHAVTNAGTFPVQASQAGTWNVTNISGTVSLPTGAATAANQSTGNTALSAIQTAVQLIDNAISGTEMQVDVVAALPAGSNLFGDVGISGARTSGGTTPYKNLDVDESEDQVKGSAGQVFWIHAMNLGSTVRYLKLYNATAASVTVGSTTPVLTFPIPTQGDSNGAGFTLAIPNGIAFGTAITIAATTGVADADTGAPGANEVIVNLGYA